MRERGGERVSEGEKRKRKGERGRVRAEGREEGRKQKCTSGNPS